MKEVMLYNAKMKESRKLTSRADGYTNIEVINCKKSAGSKSIGFNSIEYMVEHFKSKGYVVEYEEA